MLLMEQGPQRLDFVHHTRQRDLNGPNTRTTPVPRAN